MSDAELADRLAEERTEHPIARLQAFCADMAIAGRKIAAGAPGWGPFTDEHRERLLAHVAACRQGEHLSVWLETNDLLGFRRVFTEALCCLWHDVSTGWPPAVIDLLRHWGGRSQVTSLLGSWLHYNTDQDGLTDVNELWCCLFTPAGRPIVVRYLYLIDAIKHSNSDLSALLLGGDDPN